MGEVQSDTDLREGNISLILGSYNDLFSGFDPRPYSERALSDDFLQECHRAVRDKEEGAELRLLVPQHLRKLTEEAKIKKRLRTHFQHHFEEEKKKVKKTRIEGLTWFFIGIIVMFVATYLYAYEGENFFLTLIFIISEPAGWFLFWEGLDKFLVEAKHHMPRYHFYRKMSKLEIYFMNY